MDYKRNENSEIMHQQNNNNNNNNNNIDQKTTTNKEEVHKQLKKINILRTQWSVISEIFFQVKQNNTFFRISKLI